MSHELDFSTGRAGMAFIGATPWHGLGQELTPGAPLETWQVEAGLDFTVVKTPVCYSVPMDSEKGPRAGSGTGLATSKDFCVLYRDDTGADLSVVSPKYQIVQPHEIIGFYRDLTERYGFQLETAGSLKGGRKIWALANTKSAMQLRGRDENKLYLLLATSFDGSMSTQARLTNVRVVCNNTIEVATRGVAEVVVPHSTKFDADKVKLDMQIGEAWEQFQASAEAMSRRIVGRDESVRFFLDVYYGLKNDDEIRAFQQVEGNDKKVEKLTTRLQAALFNSPGAHLESAKGMLWGLVNAVTYDVDHAAPARNQENRLNSSWFGINRQLKNRAWNKALEMAA
jgi:phage/plasmid-like protein (TIGR03299 family)